MPTVTVTIPVNTNYDKLYEDVQLQYPNAVMTRRATELEVNHASADAPTLNSIIAAHNPATLTTEQTKAVARTLMLSDAKNYLSNQLSAASPNVTNIYNTVKAYVDSNPTLSQMVSNEITLAQTAFVWTLNLVSPTPIDRMRYLICVQLVLATIA